MKNLSYVANEITRGRNLNENIIKFGNGLATMYNGLGYIKLVMNYYTLAELSAEQNFDKNGSVRKLQTMIGRVAALVNKLIESGDVIDTDEIESIRNEIIAEMELTTGIVDHLRIYEYILNRVEYRFDEGEFDEDYYNSRFTNDLMHYILSDKDNVVINGKIAEVVTQLPMRLTKNSFIEHVHDAFTLYKGAYVSTVRDFVYNLSTVAMLPELKGLEEEFEQVSEILNTLKSADYKSITANEYKRLADLLAIATTEMEATADIYLMLATVVNDLYTVILTRGSAFEDVEEVERAKRALAKINASLNDNTEPADDEMMDIFAGFEGKQEKIAMSVDSCDFAVEYVLSGCGRELEETSMTGTYEGLTKVLKLQSGSTFVSLNDDKNEQVIDDDALEAEFNSFAQEITESFKNNAQIVNRAIMANVLGQLPVFFNSVDEIQGYINVALMQCGDVAERKACVEILNMVMENR